MTATATQTAASLTLDEQRRKLAAARLSGQQTKVLKELATANSAAEAAQRLGLTITALKMRRSRARAKLAAVGVMLADGRHTMGRGRHRTYAGLPRSI